MPSGVSSGGHDQRLGELHHVLDVGVRLVGLHHRELGVVAWRKTLVAEHPADLEHPVHAADDQPLEVQLERDPEVHRHVERVVVGDERTGVRASGLRMQDRRLDLHEAPGLQRATEAGDHGVADVEGPTCLGVDDEVGVALAESRVGVGEPVPLVRQRADRLGEQFERVDLDRQLAGSGRHHRAVDADPVAAVERLDVGEAVVADHGPGDEQLQLDASIGDGGEHELAGVALEQHAAGDRHLGVGLRAGREVAPTGPGRSAAVWVRSNRYGYGWRPAARQLVDLGLAARPLGGEPAARRRRSVQWARWSRGLTVLGQAPARHGRTTR